MSSFAVSARFLTSMIKCGFALAVVFSTISAVRAETTAPLPAFSSEPSMAQLIEIAKKQDAQEKANKSTTAQPSAAKKTETTKTTEPKTEKKAEEPKVTEKKENTTKEAAPKTDEKKSAQSQTVQKPVIDSKSLPTEKKPADKKAVAQKDALTKFESEIIALTNSHRAQNGLPPLAVDMSLMSTARAHCMWMASANSMQHGSYPVAENIAMGQNSPTQALGDWMNSSGHRANILSGRSAIGVAAYISSSGQIFWCQQFR